MYKYKIIERANVYAIWEVKGAALVTFIKGFDTRKKAENYLKKFYK